MPIEATYICPPIPDRSHDWQARFDWFDGDEDQPVGYGETEESAVIDLLKNSADFDDDGSIIDEIIDLAIFGYNSKNGDSQ